MEYYYDYPIYDTGSRKKRSLEFKREKRDVSNVKAVTAEEMGSQGEAKARSKRDLELDPDDLEYIFGEMYPDENYPIDNEARDEDMTDTTDEYFKSLAERAYEEEMMRRYYENVAREEEEEMEEEQEELQRLEALREWYESEVPVEEEYEGNSVVPYNGGFESSEPERESYDEQWRKRSEDLETAYEPIYYNGQPGIFVPLTEEEQQMDKRQFLSLVPGNKRKRGGFSPFSSQPGGYWGGLIPETEEERERQEAMYDRLFSLAEALRERKQEQEMEGVWSELDEK